MSRRLLVGGIFVLGAFALVAVLAVTAVAQPAPGRVVQGSDGTLYVVQGGNAWILVPDQISDDDLTALNLSGEVDGTLPDQFLIAPAPAPAAAPAPAPAPPPPVVPAPAPAAPVPAPPPAVAPPSAPAAPAPAPITGTADLTGKVPSDIPGTLIAVGATISSALDYNTKPKDVYAVDLSAGKTYQFVFSSPNHYGTHPATLGCGVTASVLNKDLSTAVSSVQAPDSGYKDPLSFSPAVGSTYYLTVVEATSCSGGKYTFTSRQL